MMNAVVKPYHEMCLNSSELIVPRDTYQRALHPARVARIAKEFDERVANEPKISFRDGHYYVMDGQNTIAARKFLNGGDDLQIRCKVYFGMTEREEALLFAQQTGISERLSAGQKLRALIFAGEPAAVAFQQATELAGVHLSFEEGRGKQRISCIATAYHEFIRLGPELYIESLDVLLNAWDGEPDSMSSANLLGICRFVELYHSEYSKSRLIAKLRQVDAWLKSQSTYQLQKPKKETHEEPPLKLQCPKNGKYYSFQEIQAFYGISRPTLDSWVLKEGIPTMKLGRVKRIQKDAFDEVLKSKRKVEEDVLKQLIEENDLPKVVFHSFRHSSITYKLKLNGGDIKAVQGDSGHAQASMVTEQYAHILDDDRRLNAQRFDDFFYQHHGAEPEALPRAEQSTPKASPVDTDAAAALAKLLADPSMATLIKNLAKNL